MILENRLYPHPTRPNDPSPLELAIFNYELKAKNYHNQRIKKNNSKDIQEKMKRDFEHLQREKTRITGHVLAQESLNIYRENNEKLTTKQLRQEKHHPTEKLASYLTAVGEPKPTTMHEAHHIICGKGRFRQAMMLRARLNLHIHGIGINDPVNGAWLINFVKNKEQDWATPDAPAHRKIHRYNYETWIGSTLGIQNRPSKIQFLNSLRNVKIKIKTGNMPAKVLDTKDELWKGV
ncbi:AHH domain-containing protein [Colwellia sp. 20A7]|uniref:AHH domain-containing protein n=1 Tax=Colwellia sp. 20A7 TaxID=2689569 RepID=UPI001F3090B1|nr:AHH domain-containing protein [Colwellia sp. 20A7]